MQPTAKALDIADQLRVLLDAADGLRATASTFDPLQSDRTFSLLLTDVGMIRFLPPLIARVAVIAPRVMIRAMPLDSRQFELKLEAGEADLALGAFPKAARHLRRQRLYFDGYVTVVRKTHPRLSALRSRAGFLAERHILVTASFSARSLRRYRQRISCCACRALLPAPSSPRKPTASPRCRPISPSASQQRSGWSRSKRLSACRASKFYNTGTSATIAMPRTAGSGR
jgi:DNA-binding transcriptional LysR family regulator